jgi:hypothetical protein
LIHQFFLLKDFQAKEDRQDESHLQKLTDEKYQLERRVREREQHLDYLKSKKTELLINRVNIIFLKNVWL